MSILSVTTNQNKATIRLIDRDGTPLLWLTCRVCGCQTTTADAPDDDGLVTCFGCQVEELYYTPFEEVGE